MTEFGKAYSQEEPEPVIKDRRRIDPRTGQVRAAGSAEGAAGGDGPSAGPGGPGAGRPATPNPGNPNDASQPLKVDLSAAELDLARQEAAERTADLQRVTAEYANYRRRVDRERERAVGAAKATVITELLPLLDDLDRARAHGDLVGSFGAVADKLIDTLRRVGLEKLGAEGDVFDPAMHEAVQFATSPDVTEPTVTSVLRTGYTLSDRLLRATVVGVTGPEHDVTAPDSDAAEGASQDGAADAAAEHDQQQGS